MQKLVDGKNELLGSKAFPKIAAPYFLDFSLYMLLNLFLLRTI
jgi:hypothetical protein